MNLRVTEWSVQVSLGMVRAPDLGLTAVTLIERSEAMFILGNSEPFAGHVFVHVSAEYVRPEQATLGGTPIGRLVSESLMEKEPKLLGTASCVGVDDECIICKLFVGTDIYNDLLHRHRAGAALPTELCLQLEGLSNDAPQGVALWHVGQFPELPIVDARLTMRMACLSQ